MPHVVIRAGSDVPGEQEETLTAYMCDWPDCGNFAEHVLGCVPELNIFAAVCSEHITRHKDPSSSREGR